MTEPTNHRPGLSADREVPPPVPTGLPAAQRPRRLPRRPADALWMVLAAFVLVLLLLLILVLQNGHRSDVYFLGAHGHLPAGVPLLSAAAFGVLLVAAAAVARLAQLRLMAVRRAGGIAVAARKGTGS